MLRALVFVHRWIGVLLCLFFAMWFGSGIVMIYVPFPSLPAAERLERSQPVPVAAVRQPFASLLGVADIGAIDRVRLIAHADRPLLVIDGRDGDVVALFADDGSRAQPLAPAEARAVAERFAGERAVAVTGPVDFDQWVVHQAFDRSRPFFRVDLADAAGTQLYVSRLTGEVVQRTRRAERLWNYAGAVVHWIYPTVIRKHWALWDQLVWWLSLAGIVGAGLGSVLGIVRLRDAWRRGRRALASPFVGWLRWHHIVGLVAAVFVTSWILSGWLSMDHGRLFPEPLPGVAQIEAFRGITLRDAVARVPAPALGALDGARELSFSAVAGIPIVAVHGGGANGALFGLDAVRGLTAHRLTEAELDAAIRAAWPEQGIVASYDVAADDAYTHLREGSVPPQTRRTVLGDDGATWIHVDRATGEIVSVMNRSRRLYRWLFNGLHSLDFPGFVERRPLWDVAMLALLGLGLVFSSTGVVLGYRRLVTTLRRR